METIKTIYGEELCGIFLVIEILKFLEKMNVSVDTSKLQKYGFKNPVGGFEIEFFDRTELYSIIDSKIAYEIEKSLIIFMFPVDIIKEL